MRTTIQTSLIAVAVALLTSGCQQAADAPQAPAAAPAARTGDDTAAGAATQAPWPASLVVVGDGFPNPGDACRRIGESAATADYLDHTAALAGCLSADDAAKLGGTVVATVDGVTLVSVPTGAAKAGDGY